MLLYLLRKQDIDNVVRKAIGTYYEPKPEAGSAPE